MHLSNELDAFIKRMRESEKIENCKIIKAYPFAVKPTILNNPIIAVSIGEINAENAELGGEQLNGTYKVNANIFVPCEHGSNALPELISSVLQSQANAYPLGVSVSKIKVNNAINCLVVKCAFTFFCEWNLGGIDNE